MVSKGNRMRFNVGGKPFETTATTLAAAGPNSFFGPLLSENWSLSSSMDTEVFIDRDPDCFGVLLNLLRTGELHVPPNVPKDLLYKEAQFYGILDLLRAAMLGPFDGNRSSFSGSITSKAAETGKAIRASPTGGCCILCDTTACVYDWMLREHEPINLDHATVTDAAWMNSQSLVLATQTGMGLFNSSTGELRHEFQISCGKEGKSFEFGAGAVCVDEGRKIFSSCRGTAEDEKGIGVWDQETGDPTDFFHDPDERTTLGGAFKLQWLQGKNCLLVATNHSNQESLHLLDFRQRKLAWTCSYLATEYRLRDVVAMDGTKFSFMTAMVSDDLFFVDYNISSCSGSWKTRSKILKKDRYPGMPYYIKLAQYEGQVFACVDNEISVLSGPSRVLTSQLRTSNRSSICDISIAGDRLFSLRDRINSFDIWETNRLPIL